jgi:hypothetical protein
MGWASISVSNTRLPIESPGICSYPRDLHRQRLPMRLFKKVNLDQFARRFEQIEKFRRASLEEIERITSSSNEEN